MDTLAHGLWGGATFGQYPKRAWGWAFLLGMCPDLFSFGPFFLTHMPQMVDRWRHHIHGPPDPHMIPAYVYHAYNVTHSLVVWSVLMVLTLWLFGRDGWVMGAWGLHIVCDIPLHDLRFFPTPFLWPFPTPFVNGHPWARGTFMFWNYAAIAAIYGMIYFWRRKH